MNETLEWSDDLYRLQNACFLSKGISKYILVDYLMFYVNSVKNIFRR